MRTRQTRVKATSELRVGDLHVGYSDGLSSRKTKEAGPGASMPRDNPATDAKKCVIVEVRHASHFVHLLQSRHAMAISCNVMTMMRLKEYVLLCTVRSVPLGIVVLAQTVTSEIELSRIR
jgi:hypothetical protein